MICPFATQAPAPLSKTNPGPRAGRGAVLHSAEGSISGLINRVKDAGSGVSWHFSVALDGTIFQHYDTDKQCWHAHASGNVSFIGVEHENAYTNGAPNHDPETDAQVEADVKLLEWLNEGPYQRQVSLWEHHELPGNSTTCPNGRIRWDDILAGLNPVPPRLWLYGDENAGLELVGKQQRTWNQGVNTDRLGREDGSLVGTHLHNAGGDWVEVLP